MTLIPTSGFAGVCAEVGLTRRFLAPALLVVILAAVVLGRGSAPTAHAHHLCPNTGSPAGPFNMETYEDHRLNYAKVFDLAGYNKLLPDVAGFSLPNMETGARSAGSSQVRAGYVPPVLLKAIAWIEASWAQADYSVPYGSAGPTLISHDCGYGLMQVTTGMQNVTGVPTLNQAMIGGHYAFNIARGAQIVIDKWNIAPEYRPIVGPRDPTVLEDWYYAVWSYNGFSYKNHPRNSIYPANRLPYSCGPSNDGFGHNRTHYPYQELVFGCIARPPIVAGQPLWTPQAITLPPRNHPAFDIAKWDGCAYSLQCAAMDLPRPSPAHKDETPLTVTRNQIIGSPVLNISTQNIALQTPTKNPTANLTIANRGTGVLAYRITSNGSWLRTSRLQGVTLGADLGARNSTLQISIDSLRLPPGRHTGVLTIESPLTAYTPLTITVTVDNYPDGTLIRGSGPQVWYVKQGIRRHVPNAFTFNVNGYNWSNIFTIPDSVLSTFPIGNPIPDAHASGRLYRGHGPGPVWVMEGGTKRHVQNVAAFSACGYGWDAVQPVNEGLLTTLPTGPALSSTPCPTFKPTEGSLLAAPTGEVFVIRGGIRRHVPNGLTLEQSGLRWGNIDNLSGSLILAVPKGNPLLDFTSTGIVLTDSGPHVYVMDGGRKRHIAGPTVLLECGFAWSMIVRVPDSRLASITTGPALTGDPCPAFSPPSGSLLRGAGPGVYVMQHGIRRHLPNAATLEGFEYRWGDIDQIDDAYLSAIPEGNPVLNLMATGQLLMGQGPRVYVMQDGKKRHIANGTVFNSCGYHWDGIYTFSATRIDSIATGPTLSAGPCPRLSPTNGSLLHGSGPHVYATQANLKRHITSPDVLVLCGYQWGEIDRVKDGVIKGLANGPQLNAPPCP